MNFFIKAAEVWQLDHSGNFLVLSSSHMDSTDEKFSDFQSASESMQFPINEGLPGITWAKRRPLIWTDLNNPYFRRKELARIAGLVCGLSIPVYAGEFLMGVVVLFFGEEKASAGVVEVWQNRDYFDTEMRLQDGYYGELARFEYISRHLTIMRGRGLPGSAWKERSPKIMTNLGESDGFLRASNAAECGITSGLAIPFFYTKRDVQVVTFLSTENNPVASRFEVWCPDESHRYLLFSQGFCLEGKDLDKAYRGVAFDRGESFLGQVWLNGRPVVVESDEHGETTVCIPLIDGGLLTAIVCIVF